MDGFTLLSILAVVGLVVWLVYRGGSQPVPDPRGLGLGIPEPGDHASDSSSHARDAAESGGSSTGNPQPPLAARSKRLGAAAIDAVAGAAALLPGALISMSAGYSDEQLAVGGFVFVIGLLAIAGYQIYLLVRRGQSVGKKAVGVRIVDADSGEIPHWVRLVFVRQGVPGLVSTIPYVGWLFLLLDVLFIARDDRRCIHDHLAGTIVCAGQPAAELSTNRIRASRSADESLPTPPTELSSPPTERTRHAPESSGVGASSTPAGGGGGAVIDAGKPGEEVSGSERGAEEKQAEPLSERERGALQRFAYRLQRLRTLRDESLLSETEHRRARREALADVEEMVAASNRSRQILVDMVKAMEERGEISAGDVARIGKGIP
jgi:uncharacterized RDD family membrane protein YckC